MKTRLLSCLFVLAPLVACGGGGGTGGGGASACSATTATKTTTVALKDLAFSPTCVLVSKGATVTFKNEETDGTPHDVLADDGAAKPVDSGNLAPGASFPVKFDTAGTFNIKCTIHPSMSTTIVVQ